MTSQAGERLSLLIGGAIIGAFIALLIVVAVDPPEPLADYDPLVIQTADDCAALKCYIGAACYDKTDDQLEVCTRGWSSVMEVSDGDR